MPIPSSAIFGPRADVRLHALGLSVADLHQAIEDGYGAAASCTDNDPRALPGVLAWGKGIGSLRDLLAPRGWTADRAAGYERAVHPSNTHALALAAGTSQTGLEGLAPRTRNPKGRATSDAVRCNAQLVLGIETNAFAGAGVQSSVDAQRETWLLLHYYDKDKQEIRIELSLPLEMQGKQITAWRERIVLVPISFSEEISIDDELDADEAIEINIPRRTD
jgi:hypothetical protein